MLVKEKLYALDDVTIIPAVQSKVESRKQCNPFYKIDGKDYFPIFVSPMECTINKMNFNIYDKNHVIPILPRTESYKDRVNYAVNNKWAAFSLTEFNELFAQGKFTYKTSVKELEDDAEIGLHKGICIRALIDNANGHMANVAEAVKAAKEQAAKNEYNIEIMVGNIANPETYKVLALAGADYVRCAIGTGNNCTTASNTATYMPLASLIDGCRQLKNTYGYKTAIVADGGISEYKNVIKALALGADYVMMGSRFTRCFESASEFDSICKPEKEYTYYTLSMLNNLRYSDKLTEQEKKTIIKTYSPKKRSWGMSTRRAQISISLAKGYDMEEIHTKTSEGVEKIVDVDYTLAQWIENMNDFLRSNMSYCNAFTLQEYIGTPIVMLISDNAKNAVNK